MIRFNSPKYTLVLLAWGATFLLLFTLPESLAARSITRSYPDFPWNGMKINATVSGNLVFGTGLDQTSGGLESYNFRRSLNNLLCADGVIDSITLSGNILGSYQGNASDFVYFTRYVDIYYYPAGSTWPTSIYSSIENTYQLEMDWPFNVTATIPAGVDIGFSITIQVAEYVDGGSRISNKYLNYSGGSFDYRIGPGRCFQVGEVTPANEAKNVDFDQPAITAAFKTPFDPESIDEYTFTVHYYDENGYDANVDGIVTINDDNTVATFIPSDPLMDGVYYVATIWGKAEAQAAGRSKWVKEAHGLDLKNGKGWSFWTMPDLTDKIMVVPVQSVEGAALIKDKPAAVRVFLRWDHKPQVSPAWQLKTLDADIRLSWWENLRGEFDQWKLTGNGSRWTPKFGTPLKREYLLFTNSDESYSKMDKLMGRESITYYGYTPRQTGTVSFKAEVAPSGQNAVKPRTFVSSEASYSILDSRRFRYAFIPINVGDWAGTGLVTPCPPGTPSGTCVNIQAMADENHAFLRSLFPLPSGHAISNRNLTQARLRTPPASLGPFHPTQGTNSDQADLLYWLSRQTLISNTWDIFIGVTPRDWLGACGNTYAENWLGLDFARFSILMGHNVPKEILAHELGHILRDWKDYGPSVLAGEGYSVEQKSPISNNARSLEGPPSLDPIKHLMNKDVCLSGSYWLDYSHYIQLYQNELAPQAANRLQSGEPLLLAGGAINPDTNTVTRDIWYILESGAWKPPTGGEYDLVLLDSAGSVLGSHSFATMAPGDGLARFILKVPFPAGTARLQIKRQGSVIHELTPSSQAPSLAITQPAAGQSWSGPLNITWTASDGNGDPLYFTIALSSNGGLDWEPLAMDLQTGGYPLDTRTISNSSDCYLKIAASDGLLTTIQTVGPFSIQNPIQVAGFSPPSGDNNTAVSSPVRVEFSEGIDPATLIPANFYVRNAQNQPVPGSITYDASANQAVWTPESPLQYGSLYTATMSALVRAPGGASIEGLPLSWSFTTEANIYPPQVVRFSPQSGDDSVSPNAALVMVQFDKPMNPATLTAASFSLTARDGSVVAGQITYNAATFTALFRPGTLLATNTQYTATLTAAVQDAQGNALEAPYSWTFQTGSENTAWARMTRHFRDYLRDQNGDGDWDTLVVEVEVSVLFTSTYQLSGRLLDKDGRVIGQAATGNVSLSGGVHRLTLSFSRQDIENHGVEGPYYFGDAVFYDAQYPSGGDALADPYTIGFTNFTRDADLLLFAAPDPGVFNQLLTFYASVANQGTSGADGVTLTVTLPTTVDFVSAASGQGSCSHNAGTVTCTIGTLDSFQSNLVAIVVTPREKGWVQFQASVTSVQDSYVANNDRQLSLEIGAGNNVVYLPLVMKP